MSETDSGPLFVVLGDGGVVPPPELPAGWRFTPASTSAYLTAIERLADILEDGAPTELAFAAREAARVALGEERIDGVSFPACLDLDSTSQRHQTAAAAFLYGLEERGLLTLIPNDAPGRPFFVAQGNLLTCRAMREPNPQARLALWLERWAMAEDGGEAFGPRSERSILASYLADDPDVWDLLAQQGSPVLDAVRDSLFARPKVSWRQAVAELDAWGPRSNGIWAGVQERLAVAFP